MYKFRYLTAVLLLCCLGSSPNLRAQSLTLNLKDVELDTLVQMVSEVTGKNFVIDQRVKGKVTVISASPMQEDELYQVFLSVLSVHGFAAVPSGKVVKIIPAIDAKSDNSPLSDSAQFAPDQNLTQVVELRYANAAQLIPILRPLVPQEAHLAAHAEKNMLIISDRAANVERIVKIVRRLDQSDSNEVDVLALQHASAAEVVRLLGSLESKSPANAALAAEHVAVADERTNSVLLSGEAAWRMRARALVAHLDTPLQTVGNTQVIYLRYAQASDLVPVLQSVSDSLNADGAASPPQEAPGGSARVNTNIQADPNTNSLVITAAPDVLQSLRGVIDKLDIRRAQILVEAVIAEIESNKSRELGVQWVVDGSRDGTRPLGLVNFSNSGGGITDIAAGILSNTLPAIGNGALFGIGRFADSGLNFAVLLRALSADNGTNVLSTPSLLTLDNEEAEIVVGRNVPFVTGQYTSTGAAAGVTNPFQTIQREDVGIKLKVRPQINEGNSIKLQIEQEVSNLVPSLGASDLVTSKRTIKTVVMVEDGNMVVLGGLMDENLTDTMQKVPGLGDLPLIGGLFRYQQTGKEKRNLMVFLHPKILRDSASESAVSNRKYHAMRDQQLQYQRPGIAFNQAEDIPVLPNLDDLLTVLPGDSRPLNFPAQP